MSELSKNILKKIKQQAIKPIPRWKFLLKNYGKWAGFALFVLMGSVSISVVIFMLTDHDWDIYRYLDKSFFEYLLLSIPYFWFLLLSVFVTFAWYDLEKTKAGYKYGFLKIGLVNILLSVVLGIVFFYAGLGIKIDKIFADNLPYYQNIHQYARPDIWENPDRGLLVGKITKTIDENNFRVEDPGKNSWVVNCLNCIFRNRVANLEGAMVKIMGKKIDDGNFQATEIRPLKPKGGMNMDYFRPKIPIPMPPQKR